LNLIFRDQFTQTGIVPGSSIRGRFRADMRLKEPVPPTSNNDVSTETDSELESETQHQEPEVERYPLTNRWYGHEAIRGKENSTTEALIKFEHASLVWLPVFCPGQPVVWVSCPMLLKRYKRIVAQKKTLPSVPVFLETSKDKKEQHAFVSSKKICKNDKLFFNLGFLPIQEQSDLIRWADSLPPDTDINKTKLVVVKDSEMGLVHEMALYRQSRVRLSDTEKKVESGAFFNMEALPVGSILVFPIGIKETGWKKALQTDDSEWEEVEANGLNGLRKELYFGGLESVGCGHCQVTLFGEL
ncbi:MAG: type III-B CRISPR module RAMP protein Cmr4, partial [Oscillatoriales cyanobacterium RM2_1_1]|nr:type III-B CRISPR module RAMP protein Cmr4 [Oscillatoriales cyanobacterium RM2_1_1]